MVSQVTRSRYDPLTFYKVLLTSRIAASLEQKVVLVNDVGAVTTLLSHVFFVLFKRS